jgi:hypothetical protein
MQVRDGSFASLLTYPQRSAVKRDPRHTFWTGHLIMMLEPRIFLQRQSVVRPDKGTPLNSIKEKQ